MTKERHSVVFGSPYPTIMANAKLDQGGYFFYFIPAGNGSDDEDDESDGGNMSDGGKETAAATPKSPTPGPSGQAAT